MIMPMAPSNIAFVVVAIDGIVTLQTGVGVVVQNFITSFSRIIESSKFNSFDTSLICLSPEISVVGSDEKLKKSTAEKCRLSGGYLKFFPTLAGIPDEQAVLWCGIDDDATERHWVTMSLSLASKLSEISEHYDQLYVFLHDIPFILTRKYLHSKNAKIIWISHGLCALFQDEFLSYRQLTESEGVRIAIENSDYIGHISNYYREVLKQEYNIPDERLIPFINEIAEDGEEYTESPYIEEVISRSKNKKIIFSWGRCAAQKGFDLLIPAVREFQSKYPGQYFLVLLMPTETGSEGYVEQIQSEITKLSPEDGMAIFQFDTSLPKNIMSQDNLSHLIFASRFEGFSNVALEGLRYSPQKTLFVCSPIQAHFEAFDNVKSAFFFSDFSINSIFEALESSINIDLRLIARQPRRTFKESYVYGLNRLGISE